MGKSHKEIREQGRKNVEDFLAKMNREVDGAPERYISAAGRGGYVPRHTQTTSPGGQTSYKGRHPQNER